MCWHGRRKSLDATDSTRLIPRRGCGYDPLLLARACSNCFIEARTANAATVKGYAVADQWFYSKNGEQYGPVEAHQLQQLASTGRLGVQDLVWKNGMPEWLPASRVKGLFPQRVLAASPPPLPASPAHFDGEMQPRLNQFSFIRLVALPVRIAICFFAFFALPILALWNNPRFDASNADPIARVVMIIIGAVLSIAAWRTTGSIVDRICEPK